MNQPKRLLLFVLSSCLILICNGCAGSLVRDVKLGEKYSDIIGSLSDIPEGKGRVFVYMMDGGPRVSYNGMGWNGPISIDGKVYNINGESFAYYDLEEGMHEISAGGISVPTEGIMGGWNFRSEGKRQIKFVISNREIKYIRIDIKPSPSFKTDMAWSNESESGNRFYPILIESGHSVKNEISSLRLDPYAVKPLPDQLIIK